MLLDERESIGAPPTVWSAAFMRVRRELDLAILTMFGSSGTVVIGLFAVYRFTSGNIAAGLIDMAIALGLGAVVAYAWLGNVTRAGGIFIALAVFACFASSLVLGQTAIYWTYLVLSVSFVVAGARLALVADLTLIGAMAAQPLFGSTAELVIFIITGLMLTVYGWIYNNRYNAQRRSLEDLATLDPLTGAGNRRMMRRELAAVVAARDDCDAAIAVLDLDYFKRINDRHGHEAGDRVLTVLAERVRAYLREADGFYRLGGEEFVVLMPGFSMQQATALLNTVRRDFEQSMQATANPTTVSIGIAAIQPGEDWAHWLKRADQALYHAKRSGRNCVVTDNEISDIGHQASAAFVGSGESIDGGRGRSQ